MHTPLTFDLFDKFGRFVMPTSEQIAELDAPTQERFAAVQSAAGDLEKATDLREAAEQSVTDAVAERDAAEINLRTLRPKVSAVANAKEHIASERAQRA